MKRELFSKIPKIDEVLNESVIKKTKGELPYGLILVSARNQTEKLRNRIMSGEDINAEELSIAEVAIKSLKEARAKYSLSLKKVINCTGIALHTNLGRAPLSKKAMENLISAISGYNNLEYELSVGARGSRHTHFEKVISTVTGAEDVMVVNNNAAATMICLATLGRGKESIVSRGELVEIGGSFRIPEIMQESGSKLVEVGTTNKTRISDYERNISENTGLLLKVHTSNYKVVGFSEEASLEELVDLGQKYNLPVVHDLGSGLIYSLKDFGIDEPTVIESIESGADVVLFSGDKMLGGAQAGIIIGKSKYIQKMKKHPLARAMRVDKITISALEATFRDYYEKGTAFQNIPVLNMLTESKTKLMERATLLNEKLSSISDEISAEVIKTKSQVGGGSAPGVTLDGYGVKMTCEGFTAAKLERVLRSAEIPIIVMVKQDEIIFDVRTLSLEDIDVIEKTVTEIVM